MTDRLVEARPKARREVIAGKYLVQYSFSAISCASTVPLIETIGTGPAGTIGTLNDCFFPLAFLIIIRCGFGSTRWAANICCCKARTVDAGVG